MLDQVARLDSLQTNKVKKTVIAVMNCRHYGEHEEEKNIQK